MNNKQHDIKATVIGAGAWGTAFALHLARCRFKVKLWVREKDVFESISTSRINTLFLPDIEIPESIEPTMSLDEAIGKTEIIFWAIPSQFLHSIAQDAKSQNDAIHIALSKGIERNTWRFPYEILGEFFGYDRIAILSGPSFAEEVASKKPSVLAIASNNIDHAKKIQALVSSSFLRIYSNPDPIGVSLGGAYKNIIAIASGICSGLNIGNNARAAIITRGISELIRLGVKIGAKSETIFGIAGLGDMVLTCTSNLSRNYSLGERIGMGEKANDILEDMQQVAEGVFTTFGALHLANKYAIELPITESVHRIIWMGSSPDEEVVKLMERPLKSEWE